NTYNVELAAETQAEKDAVFLAVTNFVKYQRCLAADGAAETRVVNRVQHQRDDQQALRLEDLIANLAASPGAAIIQLRSFSLGIDWILQQVELLEEHLQTSRSLHPSQRVMAISICGRRPCNLFIDPVVMQWNLYV